MVRMGKQLPSIMSIHKMRWNIRCLWVPLVISLSGFLYFNATMLNSITLSKETVRIFIQNNPIRNLTVNISSSTLATRANILRNKSHEDHAVSVSKSDKLGLELKNKKVLAQEVPKHNQKRMTDINFLDKWKAQTTSYCDGNFQNFGNKFFLLKNVLITKSLAYAKATGGEEIDMVKNRNESDETYTYKPGFYTLYCEKEEKIRVGHSKSYFSQWLYNLKTSKELSTSDAILNPNFTFAVVRKEFANVYWVLMDIYNIFLTLRSFGKNPNDTHILFVDARPKGHLDDIWKTFFSSITQLSQLPKKVLYKELVWNYERVNGPMLNINSDLSLHREFREAVLKSYGFNERAVATTAAYKNCSTIGRPFKVLFVWRRNYVAHPRNPSGVVSRKIANEEELINATRNRLQNCDVKGVQLDLYSVKEQLDLVSGTDVLIGMHGAAFAFSWFLPPGSGVIEMFPVNGGGNWHMAHIAKKNEVFYNKWKNDIKKNEMFKSKMTKIPPEVVVHLIEDMLKVICRERQKPLHLSNEMLKRLIGKPGGRVKTESRVAISVHSQGHANKTRQ